MKENIQHLMLLGYITKLPKESQEKIEALAAQIRELTTSDEGKIALALVGAEFSEE